jgi:tricorn protease
MRLGADNQTLMYRTKRSLRVIDGMQASGKGPDNKAETYGRSSGFIDIDRCKVLVDPIKEWTQMYREAWRLQRENFWDEKMSSVDWDLVYKRYASILPRIRTRSELSDLIWEMQGELGTSHAYEFGGDKPRPRPYYMGFLGADLDYDAKTDAYKITRILRGDSWDKEADSPLAEPGLNIEPGEIIVAVNSRRVSKDLSVHELLLNCGGTHIQLTLKRGAKTRTVNVKTLTSERFLRYRHWVERNRAIVSEATKDKVGYVHIPDMGPNGFAEFHRGYLSEFHHDGLIIDARYNRGGHVSSLLLEKLLRKRLGYDVPRWGQPQPYPMESPAGPIVAITNQFAGSDGDIFSHCFKLYELGPLVGKRTWGGVIGIHPRHRLVDGSLTTQPEFSFWFQDVGWSVENYGTDPDYEVDYRPQDYHADRDPQLERAIALVQAALKKNPVKIPNFKSRPSLPLPPLLKK